MQIYALLLTTLICAPEKPPVLTLMENYARVQIDINDQMSRLARNIAKSKAPRDETETLLLQVKSKLYRKQEGEFCPLEEDLMVLKKFDVPEEFTDHHEAFVRYLESVILVYNSGYEFFDGLLEQDDDKIQSFRAKEAAMADRAMRWLKLWDEVMKEHASELKKPKSWEVFVIRVSKIKTTKWTMPLKVEPNS